MKKYFWIVALTAFLHADDKKECCTFDCGYTPEIARAAHSSEKSDRTTRIPLPPLGLGITPVGKLNSFAQAIDVYPAIDIHGQLSVVAGYSYQQNSTTKYSYAMICLVRYKMNGTLDTTFNPRGIGPDGKVGTGTPGIVLTDLGGHSFATSVVNQPWDGKSLVAGYRYNYITLTYDFFVARYNVDGSLDATFNPKGLLLPNGKYLPGVVATSLSDGYDVAWKIVLPPPPLPFAPQTQNRILLVGAANRQIGTVAYTNGVAGIPDGTLDVTWNPKGATPGIATFSVLGTPFYGFDIVYDAIALDYGIGLGVKYIMIGQSSQGTTNNQLLLMSLNNDGTLNAEATGTSSFGTYKYKGSGIVLTQIGKYNSVGYGIIGLVNQFYITGTTAYSQNFGVIYNYQAFLAGYNGDGTLNTSFGVDGTGVVKVNIPGGNIFDEARSICFNNSNSEIIISGFSFQQGVNVQAKCTGSFTQSFYNRYRSFLAEYGIDGRIVSQFGNNPNAPGILLYSVQGVNDKAFDHKVIFAGNVIAVTGSSYDPCGKVSNAISPQYDFYYYSTPSQPA